MRRILTVCAFVTICTGMAAAADFTGRLVDASCYAQQQSASKCDPTSSSSAFVLIVAGNAYKLDEGGNTKAVSALKNRSDRSAQPDTKPGKKPDAATMITTAPVAARISGVADGDMLKVVTIEVD